MQRRNWRFKTWMFGTSAVEDEEEEEVDSKESEASAASAPLT